LRSFSSLGEAAEDCEYAVENAEAARINRIRE
jgi:hypothetical protein